MTNIAHIDALDDDGVLNDSDDFVETLGVSPLGALGLAWTAGVHLVRRTGVVGRIETRILAGLEGLAARLRRACPRPPSATIGRWRSRSARARRCARL